jgi:hypothetical protein
MGPVTGAVACPSWFLLLRAAFLLGLVLLVVL